MDELDILFSEGADQPQYVAAPQDYNFGSDLVKEIESEYTGDNTARLDRIKERNKLKKDLSIAEAKLKKIKNVKGVNNPTRRVELNKKISAQREKLRREIARIKVRLDEIAIEAGEPLDSEKKEAEKKKEEKSDVKHGEWSGITPYESDLY